MSDQQFDNTNRGALFTNRRKETPKHPDFQGSINVDGRDYWISGWTKSHPNHGQYFSLSVKPKDGAPAVRNDAPTPQAARTHDPVGRDDPRPAPANPYGRDLLGNKTDDVPF